MALKISIKTLDDYGFLLCLIGGILTVVMGLMSLIISVAGGNINWFFGAGYIGLANAIAGSIVSIYFGALAVVIGLKLFLVRIYDFIIRFDLIITSIIMIVISIIVFGIGGLIVLVGGILVLVYRLRPEGTSNPNGK